MEAELRLAQEKAGEISSSLKEEIVLEHAPLIRYIDPHTPNARTPQELRHL